MKKITFLVLISLTLYSKNSYSTQYYVDVNSTGNNNGLTWTNAFVSLSEAIASSTFGDEIWIARGTYKPSSSDGFTIPSGVKIYGGFTGSETMLEERSILENEVILDGNIGDLSVSTDNANHVVYMLNVSNQTRLDGVKIINGSANNFSNDSKGGGLYNDGGSPIIANCQFLNNSSGDYGGGICSESGNIRIEDCKISNNTVEDFGGGIHFSQGGTGIILRSEINYNNSTLGGGGAISISNGVSSVIIDRCEISGNSVQDYGGAIYVGDDASLKIYNSLFLGNIAGENIIYMHTTFNTGTHRVINSTFSGNKSNDTSNKSAIVVFTSDTEIANCIFWDNKESAGNIYKFFTVIDPVVTNCIIENGHESGTNNLDVDPLFESPSSQDFAPFISEGYDYSLSESSQGINGGDDSSLSNTFNLDLLGNTRSVGVVDIGSYEYQQTLGIDKNDFLNSVITFYNESEKNIEVKSIFSLQYILYNLNGSIIMEGTDKDLFTIDITTLSNGLYILNLKDLNSSSTYSRKLLKY